MPPPRPHLTPSPNHQIRFSLPRSSTCKKHGSRQSTHAEPRTAVKKTRRERILPPVFPHKLSTTAQQTRSCHSKIANKREGLGRSTRAPANYNRQNKYKQKKKGDATLTQVQSAQQLIRDSGTFFSPKKYTENKNLREEDRQRQDTKNATACRRPSPAAVRARPSPARKTRKQPQNRPNKNKQNTLSLSWRV